MKTVYSQDEYKAFIENPFDFYKRILNADLGEGNSNDESIMRHIHAANIACGGHAGDDETVRTAVSHALNHQLIIGAHPSYKDKENFGRISLFDKLDPETIVSDALEQITKIERICQQEHTTLRYVKPHGALYHDLNSHTELAQLLVKSLKEHCPNLALIGFTDSLLIRIAESQGVETWPESFADRRYDSNGLLVNRNDKAIKAVLHKEDSVSQALSLFDGWVNDCEGNRMSIDSKTLCLHSDTPHAEEIAHAVYAALFTSSCGG